jgi:acyl carrier protein
LHGFLAESLPPYMVPSAFLVLPVLPLSPNGKVDTRALPVPEGERPTLAAAYAPPQSELERRIATVWQEVLKVSDVGLHDNFFELGGNSMLIAQAHRRLRDELGANLALVDLFKLTTVSALARHLGSGGAGAEDVKEQARSIKDEAERRRAAMGRRQQAARGRGPRK